MDQIFGSRRIPVNGEFWRATGGFAQKQFRGYGRCLRVKNTAIRDGNEAVAHPRSSATSDAICPTAGRRHLVRH